MESISVLIPAIDNSYNEIAKLLIEHGAHVNFTTKYGYTPLIAAVDNDLFDITDLLLKKGAHINKRDKTGDSAIPSC